MAEQRALALGAQAVSPAQPAKPQALADLRSAPVGLQSALAAFPLAPVELQPVAFRQVDSDRPVVTDHCQAWAAEYPWMAEPPGAAGAPFRQCVAHALCCRHAAPGAGFHSVRVSMKVCAREPAMD